jgi:hypothetical protein
MRTPTEYLEAAKVEEVADQLAAEGFMVLKRNMGDIEDYDVVATKNGQKIAIEVKARSALLGAVKDIRALREQAFRQGFTEFRLVITSPPHETRVEIDGLDGHLFRYFIDHLPEALATLAPHTRVTKVTFIEIDAIHVTAGETRVAGTGVVEVELDDGEGEERRSTSWEIDFPFDFAITLDRDLTIKAVERLDVDTSSLRD